MVIEHDGDSLADVLTGDARPLASTLVVHAHRHHLTLQVVKLAAGAGHDIAVEHGLAVDGAQSNQVEDVGTVLSCCLGLDGPSQLQVGRQRGASGGRVDDGVHSSGVASGHHTHNGAATTLLNQHLIASEFGQCATLRSGGSGLSLLSLGRVDSSGGRVGGLGLSLSNGLTSVLVQSVERTQQVRQRVGLIELQVSGTLQQLAHALGFLDTGQLEQDAAGALQLLDVGGNHTEAVDTVAQHLV